jgi:hypothetical protein
MTKSAASLEPLHDRSRLTAADAITLLEGADLSAMMEVAATLRDRGHASIVSEGLSAERVEQCRQMPQPLACSGFPCQIDPEPPSRWVKVS